VVYCLNFAGIKMFTAKGGYTSIAYNIILLPDSIANPFSCMFSLFAKFNSVLAGARESGLDFFNEYFNAV
jgi:hypothetical protein